MITRLTLRNFKSVGEQAYDFTQFDLLVGRNNSGKSTILQALAIWQFCVDEFHRSKRSGSTGVQVVLPNFTALPVPEFNLLWKDRTDRAYPSDEGGKKKQEFILIEISLEWRRDNEKTEVFGIQLRYGRAAGDRRVGFRGLQHYAVGHTQAIQPAHVICRKAVVALRAQLA